MGKTPVTAVFDIGKTNKKLVSFDEQYNVMDQHTVQLIETEDEDGFPCEDIDALNAWVLDALDRLMQNSDIDVTGINVCAYGASFVYLDESGKVMLPLYNYLKPFPPELLTQFYEVHGGKQQIGQQTSSPPLGSLNSGLQFYKIKTTHPEIFEKIKYALHLPQYISYLLCGKVNSDLTSVGCHTYLWDFTTHRYHSWVVREKMEAKFPALVPSTSIAGYTRHNIPVGVGLHDSSSALIPYFKMTDAPFLLLSTGTWCISLNPFDQSPLTDHELESDCLCYLSYDGKPVKAARFFAGYEHDQQVKKLALHFKKPDDYYLQVKYDAALSHTVGEAVSPMQIERAGFQTYEQAYHYVMAHLITRQVSSTNRVLVNTTVRTIFVDGGFSKNEIYMNMLVAAFPLIKVTAAPVALASALGAAMALKDGSPVN